MQRTQANHDDGRTLAAVSATEPAALAYEPPTLTSLGALHELLMAKTAGDTDFTDNDPVDPRSKV